MKYLNQRLWTKSYLLEFKRYGVVEEAFAFSVPPQSEEFDFPQRIAETKTFGGSIIDDYGNDTVRITLQGTTINQELKIIYRSSKGFKFLNGEEEVFYLQKIIKEWGKIDKLANKEIYLYQLNSGTKSLSNKWWKVYIQDYQIRRSKDAPLTYNYTIQFLADSEEPPKTSSVLQKMHDAIDECIAKITWLSEQLDTYLSYYSMGLEYLSSITSAIAKTTTVVDSYENSINGFIDASAEMFNETRTLGDTVIAVGKRYSQDFPLSVYDSCQNLATSINDFSDWVISLTTHDINKINKDESKTNQEVLDELNTVASDMTNTSNKLLVEITKSVGNIGYTINPGASGEDDELLVVCGYIECVVKDNMSWDSLALKYFGDANYGGIISTYNKDKDLVVGNKIYIPLLYQNYSNNLDNDIRNEPNVKDNYGKDLKLDKNKDLSVSNGDLAISQGQDNLNQSLENRLTGELGSRVRDETYGIRASIGDTTAASSFILSSIEQTLSDEPRIKSVDNIQFTGKGDGLEVLIEYTDINDANQSYGGKI